MKKRSVEIPPAHHALVRRIAVSIARSLPAHVLLDDLVSDGWIGYLDACQKFDATRNVSFEYYVAMRIRGAILDGLRALDFMPRDARTASKKLARTVDALTNDLRRAPEADEIAGVLCLTLDEYHSQRLDLSHAFTFSLDDLPPHEADSIVSADVASRGSDNVLDVIEALQIAGRLEQALACLEAQEEWIIRQYFYQNQTQHSIGEKLGVTESRVCQRIPEILAKLRPIYEAISRAVPATSMEAGKTDLRSIDFTALQAGLDAALTAECSSDSDGPQKGS